MNEYYMASMSCSDLVMSRCNVKMLLRQDDDGFAPGQVICQSPRADRSVSLRIRGDWTFRMSAMMPCKKPL